MIAEHLSVEEVEVIRDMFSLMDTDNDGKVSFEELKAGLKKVGSQLAEPEMKMLMEVVSFYGSQVQTETLLYGFKFTVEYAYSFYSNDL